jgi:hypothetical protein
VIGFSISFSCFPQKAHRTSPACVLPGMASSIAAPSSKRDGSMPNPAPIQSPGLGVGSRPEIPDYGAVRSSTDTSFSFTGAGP